MRPSDLEAMAFGVHAEFQVVAEASQLRLVFMKFGDEMPSCAHRPNPLTASSASWLTTSAKSPGRGQVEVIVATHGNTVTSKSTTAVPVSTLTNVRLSSTVSIERRRRRRDRTRTRYRRSIIRATQAQCTIGTASMGGAN